MESLRVCLFLLTIFGAIWVKTSVDLFPPQAQSSVSANNPDLSSGRVSLGDGDFILRVRDGQLYLEHERKKLSNLINVRTREKLDANHPLAAVDVSKGIEQVELSRWSRDSLVGVIKQGSSNSVTFRIFTITRPRLEPQVLDAFVCYDFDGDSDERILAVCGTVSSPQITVMTGKVSPEDHRIVMSGHVTVSPYGPREESITGIYSVKYQSVAE